MSDDDAEIMTGQQVADLLQVSPRTLEEWRQTRTGPPYRRMGRHVRYMRREVLAWFESLAMHA
ncbi:DNA-binding protein [Cryobacterium glaciale]|uniref:DNA-binding protein n=2 Tax=Cryobacterium glaciale TaxID=1259145 RepID=A0A4R8URH6_9MICO|nr:helix-turn-helix domain-containing protein [Cryobacterium sp. N19]TFB69113.1 DNA-binding protein [Cryobacterium glaciale]